MTVANKISESARPARLAKRKAMIMPTERLMKTNGCPIQETHRAKRTVGLRSILSRLTCHLLLVTSNNASAYFTKPDAVSVTLAPATNCKNISVFEPFARFAVGQL